MPKRTEGKPERFIAVAFDVSSTAKPVMRTEVHAVAGDTSNYVTLCGLDGNDRESGQLPAKLPKAPKITCPGCKAIIRHSRTYSERDFAEPRP